MYDRTIGSEGESRSSNNKRARGRRERRLRKKRLRKNTNPSDGKIFNVWPLDGDIM